MSPSDYTILVVGGAGYIGSHMVHLLNQQGYNVVALDNLSTGRRGSVKNAPLVVGDLNNKSLLQQLFHDYTFDAVINFAAFIQVGESVTQPAKYYHNNLIGTLNLLETMLERNVRRFIFSSSAAVYGDPQYLPIDEQHPKNPLNPYGRSKWIVEEILQDYARAYRFKSVSLRYFNAAGAMPEAGLGPCYPETTHLILRVLEVAQGKLDHIDIYGNDYATPDGTCLRDYVHVTDLCEAHALALERLLMNQPVSPAYNLGSEEGYSVKEVIKVARNITNHPIPEIVKPRRAGDPERLLANSLLAKQELGWRATHSDLTRIIQDTWKFLTTVSRQ